MWAQVAEETFQACKEVDSIGTCWSRVLPGGHEGKPQGHIAALSCLMASFPFRVGGTCPRLPSPRRSEPAALRDSFCPGSAQGFLLLTIKAMALCLKCLVVTGMQKGA